MDSSFVGTGFASGGLWAARTEVVPALEGVSIAQARLEPAKRQQTMVQARVQVGSASTIEALEAQVCVSESEAGEAQAWQV